MNNKRRTKKLRKVANITNKEYKRATKSVEQGATKSVEQLSKDILAYETPESIKIKERIAKTEDRPSAAQQAREFSKMLADPNHGIILECIAFRYLMNLSYKREKDNKRIKRTVEPYEVKKIDGSWYLYAYDTTGGTAIVDGRPSALKTRNIKSFLMKNIITVRNQRREFVPRHFARY